MDDDACFQAALQRACLGRRSSWDKFHVEMFVYIDSASNSCVLVTSRVSGIAVGAPEVAPPFKQVEHDAADACGRLPLAAFASTLSPPSTPPAAGGLRLHPIAFC